MDMICYCGHDCSKCLVYRATLADDETMRDESARFYKAEFNIDILPEKIRCFGGRSDEVMEACEPCPFRKCCRENQLHACSECLAPCERFGWYAEQYVNKYNQIME